MVNVDILALLISIVVKLDSSKYILNIDRIFINLIVHYKPIDHYKPNIG